MSFPRYERYKDSGVEWLGDVPEHWEITKVKQVATKIGSGKTPRGGSEVYVSEGVIFLRSQNVHDTGLRLDDVVYIRQEMDEEMDNTKVHGGDILLNVTGASIGRTSIVPMSLGAANVSQHVCIIRIPDIDSREFLAVSLQGHSIKSQIELAQNGAAREGLNFEQIGNLVFALPASVEELRSITSFLHRQLQQIDALIEEQRRLIELLKEKRQVVISHAVTKGLHPDIPMKDSCVDWLGEVPQHWDIVPLRFLVKFISGGTPDKKEPLYWEGSIPWVSAKDMKVRRIDDSEDHISENAVTESGLKLISAGHLLMVVRGMILAHSLPVALTCGTLTINQDLKAIKCGDKLEVAFLQFVFEALKSHIIANAGESAHGTKKLESEMLGRLEIPVPPVQEQQRIAAEMEREVELLDATGHSAMQTIELLQERRSALISAAVTGKVDVRASVAKPIMSATQYSSGFAHQLLAAEILDRCNSQRMGRIKLQKLIHLCEYHGQVSEVQGDYSRKAAGPFDARAMAGISKNLKKQKWFEEVKEGERYVYRPLEKRGEHKKYLAHWQAEMPRIDEVLSLLGNFKTRECEIVSTLYAAWNDLLIDGGSADDAAILHEASSAERWHKSKEQIARERWKKALQWMKDKGLVPVGYGKHTRHTAGQIGTAPEVAQ